MQKQGGFLDNMGGCFQTMGITALFFVIGAGLSWWGWTIVLSARASADWPTTEGQVTSSEINFSTDAEGGDSYTPHVTYTYSVNGSPYQNTTIKFGENSYGSKRAAQEIQDRYPVGQIVTVHYDPAKPDRSVLEAGVTAGSYIVLGIGVVFLLVSILPPPIYFIRYLMQRRG